MIKIEYLNDNTLIKHFSDEGFMLLQVETGTEYGEAIDVAPCKYTYIETDKLIEVEKVEEDEEEVVE